ncbi:1-(5-phosphoribosyl)-5-amino-4-imidazole- carboxylate (AIR) carboxylase [Thermobaculum terrenum ATCC BAA-798]|uniref:1-(5-phosphoribosyl)-5-amino-4-imidazole-carboxylate (AIR) carboxylase n=1 Tax=Thermobaculum terrenum (strain ATCC BAA-798 / CCMEE 7001 / YNP1) TaxID=525904 RepID=D1CCR8_THET1|nr:nickel pincer cofactor biosynthesis protein LarB [Thermobaculum terrenum]ACZ42583.1 1-(5-phosphoribosyl)-5-amino-4-imidazole- carboxylate (AIR) carboxylase [Thermobaculum terrenum ATCC BAA-798]
MDPFADLIASLSTDRDEHAGQLARVDLHRQSRKGVPEVIYAPGKNLEVIFRSMEELLSHSGRVIVSRPSPEIRGEIIARYNPRYHVIGNWSVAVEDPNIPLPVLDATVGIITAGSSDWPIAEEAQLVVRHMGCKIIEARDVGVAGIHRLFPPLREMLGQGVDVIIVVAGMDGALPSVVSGLVDVPVVGIPTSTGYGAGGQGWGALLSMLQTCAPGLSVVNIDNGIGGGAVAGMIARQVSKARRANSSNGK